MTSWCTHSCGNIAALAFRLRIVTALVCIMAAVSPGHAQNYASTVVDLARFATWPDKAQHGMSFRICLRDDDPAFGDFMGLRGIEIGGRPVSLHSIEPDAMATRPCHIFYFSAGLASSEILQSLKNKPVLTVSPQNGFARSGGVVELARDEGSLVIVIDRSTMIEHPLQVSAQLLDLARGVDR